MSKRESIIEPAAKLQIAERLRAVDGLITQIQAFSHAQSATGSES